MKHDRAAVVRATHCQAHGRASDRASKHGRASARLRDFAIFRLLNAVFVLSFGSYRGFFRQHFREN